MVCPLNDLPQVVLTDYPDISLIKNLEYNVERNVPDGARDRVHVKVRTLSAH